MKSTLKRFAEILIVVLLVQLGAVTYRAASAHTGSPSMVTWNAGDYLTTSDLNNAMAHLHNTFSAGITNSMISSNAAISHTKMATPALLPKAWGVVGLAGVCDAGAAAGTNCTIDEDSQVTAVQSSGTAGLYRVNLDYTPANANFVVLANSGTADRFCEVVSPATSTPHFQIRCRDSAGALQNAIIHFVVFDS